MAWPWLSFIAKNVPWAELVRRAPDIIARSRELLEESRRPRPRALIPAGLPVTELAQRVEQLEARDAEHARLIAAMVDQLEDMTESVQILAARNRMLLWLVAFLAAGEAVVLVVASR